VDNNNPNNQNSAPISTPPVLENQNPSSPPVIPDPIGNPESSNPIKRKPKFSFFVIIGIIIFLLLAGSAAGFYVFKPQIMNLISKPTPTPIVIPGLTRNPVSPSPTPDPTAGWKTYTSTKANYSFKHPAELPLVNVSPSPQCASCVEDIQLTPNFNPASQDNTISLILVFKDSRIKTIDDYVSTFIKGDQTRINLQYTTISGEKAVSSKLSGGIPPLPIAEYAVVRNGLYYIIRLEDCIETNKHRDKNVTLFDQILSTFKFTN